MVGGLSIFCRYHKSGKSRICSHQYLDVKICSKVVGFDVNSLYLYCSRQETPCNKEEYIEVDRPNDMKELCNQVMNRELFGFLQVDIHIPDELIDKFSEFCPLLIVDSIPDELIPSHMREYQMRTGQKMIHGTKKLLGVMHAQKILLYSPMLKWYLNHGLKVTFISTSSTSPANLLAGFQKK